MTNVFRLFRRSPYVWLGSYLTQLLFPAVMLAYHTLLLNTTTLILQRIFQSWRVSYDIFFTRDKFI